MSKEFESKVQDFFAYKWLNDKNQWNILEKDVANFEEIPDELQDKLYYLYLFPIILNAFKKYFSF